MKDDITIGEITQSVEQASTDFEKINTELKRKYLVFSIDIFNKLAQKIDDCEGSFGTGYPFYALDSKLQGRLPIIQEQIRYNRQLVRDGEPFQESIWKCKSCLHKNYNRMKNLKVVCKPCPNIDNKLKPRKIINRIPDLDLWLVCKDGKMEETQNHLSKLLDENNIRTSDINPILSIEDLKEISQSLKRGEMPEIFLPIDAHIIEYSILKELITDIPNALRVSKHDGSLPYLPIHPISYRKEWQYDDEAYNYVYDFLSAFTEFNFEKDLQDCLNKSRYQVSQEFTENELFDFLLKSSTQSNFRRFQSPELEEYFKQKVFVWKNEYKDNIINKSEEGR